MAKVGGVRPSWVMFFISSRSPDAFQNHRFGTGLRSPRFWRYNEGVTTLDCITALKALGEETRMRMLHILFDDELSVNEVSERLKVSPYNVSKHLRILREAGLVTSEKQGKQRLYTVMPEFKVKVMADKGVLDLGCCSFRLDKLLK